MYHVSPSSLETQIASAVSGGKLLLLTVPALRHLSALRLKAWDAKKRATAGPPVLIEMHPFGEKVAARGLALQRLITALPLTPPIALL
jgi:hypothetical protein